MYNAGCPDPEDSRRPALPFPERTLVHLILTHDQADFDAVASLLAASLLEPQAVAVLPPRVNRNVRGYLTLYGERFHLLEQTDLPSKRVGRVTLVDTQSLLSVKGVSGKTQVEVLDHHPAGSGLHSNWKSHLEQVGATTTLLVEALLEEEPVLDMPAATLLLLGIYEDTGSLSYPGTTPRDVRACARLLEQGASLRVADEFLNQPLSPDQRRLYERLLEEAQTLHYHGLPVLIACGSAEGMLDEVSALAHKLGDVFDVSGLFMLVRLNGNIQLVARSTSASIDVGKIAERFGGGGHSRAAAALIRDGDLAASRQQLIQALEQLVEPVRTVAEIMSRDPQVLDLGRSIAEAAELMRQFGHEGYPVTDGGRVVGLLTRRSVDRAMSHRMGVHPVSQVMEAGSVTVSPADSLHRLQRLMIEHNWGQVPVVDPTGGQVIGIVTRTDLLKALGQDGEPSQASLAPRLEASLPPARLGLLKLVSAEAEALGAALYLVGGFVRDLLLDLPSVDFDLVVEGDAIALAGRLAEQFGGKLSSHQRFGTAKWRLDRDHAGLRAALGTAHEPVGGLPLSLDLVSARTEFYTHPTALPSIARGSIKLDLHRRDFSINTLALRLDGRHYGELLDPWGGGRDLRERQIRVLHSLSFVDDPTRMLRAVRLENRLGFVIEERTLELLHRALPTLEDVSGERIRGELSQIFREDRLLDIMARLQELGLLPAIHPALSWSDTLGRQFLGARGFSPPPSWRLEVPPSQESLLYAVWLAGLGTQARADLCDRMHFPQALRQVVLQTNQFPCELEARAETLVPSEAVDCLEGVVEGALVATWLALADRAPARRLLEQYLESWRWVLPHSDGRQLQRLGVPSGPAYRRILHGLRAAWLDGEVKSPEEESTLLEQLVEQEKARG
ncbi:MAG TPA: CBS domain-containing protein [Anaerolineales bacterium]|nr:CBS domain-containing protein [Anaerolineales bacterium]